MLIKLGSYYLNQPISDALNLTEFSSDEYYTFELSAYKRMFANEKIFHGDNISFLEDKWDTVIGSNEGKIYKISIQHFTNDKKLSDNLFNKTLEYLTDQMGNPEEHSSFSKRYIWDRSSGNVLLNRPHQMDHYTINLILTLNFVKGDISGEVNVNEIAGKNIPRQANDENQFLSKIRKEYQNFTQEELRRLTWLRAMEWTAWPAFLSMGIGQLLLLFETPIIVIIQILIANFIWSLICQKFISIKMAGYGVWISNLKWITSPLVFIIFLTQNHIGIAFLALIWPFLAMTLQFAKVPTSQNAIQLRMLLQLHESV